MIGINGVKVLDDECCETKLGDEGTDWSVLL